MVCREGGGGLLPLWHSRFGSRGVETIIDAKNGGSLPQQANFVGGCW